MNNAINMNLCELPDELVIYIFGKTHMNISLKFACSRLARVLHNTYITDSLITWVQHDYIPLMLWSREYLGVNWCLGIFARHAIQNNSTRALIIILENYVPNATDMAVCSRVYEPNIVRMLVLAGGRLMYPTIISWIAIGNVACLDVWYDYRDERDIINKKKEALLYTQTAISRDSVDSIRWLCDKKLLNYDLVVDTALEYKAYNCINWLDNYENPDPNDI